jgi:hypothetical protein
MTKQIERIKKIRSFLIDLVSDLSVEQLNEVPPGFNNNIIWNIGHLIAVQQSACYTRAGIKPVVDEKLTMLYKPGTKPEQHIAANEADIIKKLLLSSLDLFDSDYKNNLFTNYISWTTRYGVELSDIEDVVQFLMYHEGLHSGSVISLKKLVKNKP